MITEFIYLLLTLPLKNFTMYDIIVIGGGCVGLSTAYKLNMRYPNKKILLLEKEERLSAHQTGRNSGVIHSGIYYKPGSFKAKNCVDGRRELVAFAKEHKVDHDICGKLIVATQESELAHMNKVFNNGLANGVEGIEIIDAAKVREIEPYAVGIGGIYVPCTGIIDYVGLTVRLGELITAKFPQSKIMLGTEATAFQKGASSTTVVTNKGNFEAKYVITCAGLQSDRIAKKEGAKSDSAIVGFRGDYYDLSEKGMSKVKNLIYPVPNPQFPFLGVHFTRMIHGGVECGPNAVFVFIILKTVCTVATKLYPFRKIIACSSTNSYSASFYSVKAICSKIRTIFKFFVNVISGIKCFSKISVSRTSYIYIFENIIKLSLLPSVFDIPVHFVLCPLHHLLLIFSPV